MTSLTVKNDWKNVKVGDRVRFAAGGGDGFEATVTKLGRKWGSYGNIEGAAFTDNVTYKLDGTPRKNTAKNRRDQMLMGSRVFEIVEQNYPTTFGELTDAHIGMRFEVDGNPNMTGTYEGLGDRDGGTTEYRYFTEVMWRNYLHESPWEAKDEFKKGSEYSTGYFARADTPIRYVSGTDPKKDAEGVDIDAKLAAYFNQELDKLAKSKPGAHARVSFNYGESIVKIMKTLTE